MTPPGIRLLTGGDLEIAPGIGADLSGPLPRALFVALLLIGAEPVSREYLATLLWPEADAATGRQRLRMTLHNLRRGLGPALDTALISTPGTLSVNAALVGVDLVEFQRHGSGATAESRRQAIALYRGNLLERFPPISASFDELLDHQREACRAAFLSICRRALAEDVGAGDVAAYDLLLEKALRVERTNADLVADAMRFYAAAGSAQRVMDIFDRHARALRSDIDVNPEPELSALRDEMRALALKRMHERAPPTTAPEAPTIAPGPPATQATERLVATAPVPKAATAPVPKRAASLKRLSAGAGVILIVAAVLFWDWRKGHEPDRIFVMMLVGQTSGDCGLPEARIVFENALLAAVTGIEGAIVDLSGTNRPGGSGNSDVFTVTGQIDCDGLNARGALTVARGGSNVIVLSERYALNNVRENDLEDEIRKDLNEALQP